MGEGVEALLVGAVLAHVTFLTTLAIAHWFRAVGDLMAFLPYCTSGTRLVRGCQQFGDLPLSSCSSLSTSLAPGTKILKELRRSKIAPIPLAYCFYPLRLFKPLGKER